MHFTTTIAASLSLALASLTIAIPTEFTTAKRQSSPVCTGLEGTPQCCATDVLGLADLQCANPPTTPTDVPDFVSICAAIGQEARCCAIPVLEQALLCSAPLG